MDKCTICKNKASKYRKTEGKILKSIKKQKPSFHEDSLICYTCYRKAYYQLKRYLDKRKVIQMGATLTMVESQHKSSSTTEDSIDAIVNQPSMRNARNNKENTEARRQLPSPQQQSQYSSLRSASATENTSSTTTATKNLEVERSEDLNRNILVPIASLGNILDTEMVSENVVESQSSNALTSQIVRVYESEDEEFEMHREDDRLPGVQPYIRGKYQCPHLNDENYLLLLISKTNSSYI